MPDHMGHGQVRGPVWRRLLVVALALAFTLLAVALAASQLACGHPQARSVPPASPTDLPGPATTRAGTPLPTLAATAIWVRPTVCPALAGRFELLGQAGGPIGVVAVQGRYAYLGIGPRLAVLDLSQPAQPRQVGEAVPGMVSITALVVAGDYVYTADIGGRLHAIEVADPARPRETSYYDTFRYAHALALAGHHLYLATDAGLHIFDAGDPARPAPAGFFDTPGRLERLLVQDGLALLGVGDYAGFPYRDLRIVDVADPARPRELAVYDQQPVGAYPLLPAGLHERHAYVVTGGELRVLDLADPAHPAQVGSYPLVGLGPVGQSAGAQLTLASGGGSLLTLDLSDPAQPREARRLALPGAGTPATVAGDLAYIVERQPAGDEPAASAYLSVLHIIDLAAPGGPAEVGQFVVSSPVGWSMDTQAYRLTPVGSRFYVAADKAGLQVLDLADPAQPRLLGSGGAPGFFYDVAVLQADRTYALAADGSWGPAARAGLRIFDVTDPARIAQVGFYDSPGNALSVAVAGHFAYLADGEKGLRIVDVTDPVHPVEAGAYEAPGLARGVAIAGRYACVADQEQGLHIVDIADPARPRQVTVYAPSGQGADIVVVAGERIYLPTSQGVSILRLTDAGQPVALGQIQLPNPSQVAVSGSLACVESHEGLYAFDVADAAHPRALACLDLRAAGSVRAMTIAEGKVYVATDLSGLCVLRLAAAQASAMPASPS